MIEREVRRTGKSFKEVLNDSVRRGFTVKASPSKPFKIRAFPAGPPAGMSLDNVEELIEYLEGPVRK